jgi:3-methylcrotonyl-CoA carboxylase alpha subunit
VACPAFANADLDTGLIERERSFLFPENHEIPRDAWLLASLAELLGDRRHALTDATTSSDPHSPWHLRDGWRMNGAASRELKFRHGEVEKSLSANYAASGGFSITLDGQTAQASGRLGIDSALTANIDGRLINVTVIAAGERRHVFANGLSYVFAAVDPLFHAGSGGGAEGGLTAPMPGKVIALLATVGATVDKGAPLLILEAMKMEHTITSPSAGTVKSFCFAVGDQVGDGAELVEFVPS